MVDVTDELLVGLKLGVGVYSVMLLIAILSIFALKALCLRFLVGLRLLNMICILCCTGHMIYALIVVFKDSSAVCGGYYLESGAALSPDERARYCIKAFDTLKGAALYTLISSLTICLVGSCLFLTFYCIFMDAYGKALGGGGAGR